MDHRIERVISQMNDNLHRELSLSVLALSVNLSTSYLHHLFRRETGSSPARYCRLLRLMRAKELLVMTRLSVKQVKVSVGLNDRSHFDREFKKMYGITPAKCRKVLTRPRAATGRFNSSPPVRSSEESGDEVCDGLTGLW